MRVTLRLVKYTPVLKMCQCEGGNRLRLAMRAWCVEAMAAKTEEVTERGFADMRAMMHLANDSVVDG